MRQAIEVAAIRLASSRATAEELHEIEEFLAVSIISEGRPVDELLRDGVNLLQQEALGGHVIWKHSGRDDDFLRLRQRSEQRKDGTFKSISTFDTEAQAVTAIDAALRMRGSQEKLRALAARGRTHARRHLRDG